MSKRRGPAARRRRPAFLSLRPVPPDRSLELSLEALALNNFGNRKNDMTLLPLKLNSGVRKRIARNPG
jgi:hypothetical protein